MHTFETSNIDYGNSLLYNTPQSKVHKLQILQNWAARTITKTLKYRHITPTDKELHWLPAKQRIAYRIAIMTYKCPNILYPP